MTRPTQEQILQWAREVWGDDSGKPWSEAALLHITQLATLAYEAGRKDENEDCAKVCEELGYYAKHGGWGCADAIRARREQ